MNQSFDFKLSVALCAALFASSLLAFDNLLVSAGETKTISSSATYGEIRVEGELTVASGVKVKIDKGSGGGMLAIGSGAGKKGVVNIEQGASIDAGTGGDALLSIGGSGGEGVLNMNGGTAKFTDGYIGWGGNGKAVMSLSNGALLSFSGYFYSGNEHVSSSPAPVDVTLSGEGTQINAYIFRMYGDASSFVHFRGGLLSTARLDHHSGAGNFEFDGTSDHAIRLKLLDAQWGDGHDASITSLWGGSGHVVLKGDCDFVKTGVASSDQLLAKSSSYVSMQYTGATRVEEGGFKLVADNILPKTTDLVLASGTTVNLGGKSQQVRSVSGLGRLVAGGTGNALTLAVGENGTAQLTSWIDSALKVVKKGAGTLEVLEDRMGDISVEEGCAKVLNRADHGYAYYRFKIDSAYSPRYDALHLAELYLWNGTVDVATSYLSVSVNTLFDKNYDDNHKWWIGGSYTTDTPASFDSRHASIRYAAPTKVTSYSWVTAGDSPSTSDIGRDPGSWRLMGSPDNGTTLTTLSTVGHREYLQPGRRTETKKFEVTYPQPMYDSLKVAPGARLELSDGVELSCGKVSVQGGDVRFGEGARLVATADDDQAFSYPSFAGGSFEKGGAGRMTVIGQLTGLDGLAVSEGALTIDNGYLVPNSQFKFVILSNYWMVANASTPPSTDDQKTIQFGEVALYDRLGKRVNLNASVSGHWTTSRLCDGDTTTSSYYTDLPVSYAFTMTLSNASGWKDEVVGYRFAIETAWGGLQAKTPRSWEVYTRASSSDEWQLIDRRLDEPATVLNSAAPWAAWNGGEAWAFTQKSGRQVPAFDATTTVSVAAGATLDVSGTGSATVIGSLSVDATGAGTLRGGVLADVGTIAVSNRTGGNVLPLTIDGTAVPASLDGWTVAIDGKVKGNWRLSFDGTHLVLNPPGTVLVFR